MTENTEQNKGSERDAQLLQSELTRIDAINQDYKNSPQYKSESQLQTDNTDNIHYYLAKDKKEERRKRIIIGVGLTAAALLGAVGLKACSDSSQKPAPTPDQTPTPIIQPVTPTEIPTATVTEVVPTATSTPVATETEVIEPTPTPTAAPLYQKSEIYVEDTLEPGQFYWSTERADAHALLPNAGPNELNDIATSASQLLLSKENLSAKQAYDLPVGHPFEKAGSLTIETIANCLEGNDIPFASLLANPICRDIITTSGADLSRINDRTTGYPPFDSGVRVNDELITLYTSTP